MSWKNVTVIQRVFTCPCCHERYLPRPAYKKGKEVFMDYEPEKDSDNNEYCKACYIDCVETCNRCNHHYHYSDIFYLKDFDEKICRTCLPVTIKDLQNMVEDGKEFLSKPKYNSEREED